MGVKARADAPAQGDEEAAIEVDRNELSFAFAEIFLDFREGTDRDQGTMTLVAVRKGPGDWKSTLQSEPSPAPPISLQPAPSRAMNSTE